MMLSQSKVETQLPLYTTENENIYTNNCTYICMYVNNKYVLYLPKMYKVNLQYINILVCMCGNVSNLMYVCMYVCMYVLVRW